MIREAHPRDLPSLRAIQTAALDEPWPELLTVGVEGPPLVYVVESGDDQSGDDQRTVTTERVPVGYALVVPDPPLAYLAEFAVAPEAQGKGHGSTLLAETLARLERSGVETVRLTARADDERVRSFYEDFGFSVVERIADHYADGDGVLMERGR